MTTAATVIGNAMHLFGILDAYENPSSQDLINIVPILNDMLRQEHADAAAQYLISTQVIQLPAGVSGSVYTFQIGIAQSSYLVQTDAVGVRTLWMNDLNLTVNRETRQAPKTDVVRTTFPGIVTKWHQERQADNSVLVTAWQPPRAPAQALIELGGRVPLISNPTGGDTVGLPSEGIHDATLMLGRRICGSYGRPLDKIDPVLAADSEAVNKRWREWARGQQWMRFLRA